MQIKFIRSLVDTAAQSSYASAVLISRISAIPVQRETRQIIMLLHTSSKKIEIQSLIISDWEYLF